QDEQLKQISSVSVNDRDNIEGNDVGCADVEFYDDVDDYIKQEDVTILDLEIGV
ncbi:MAG: hypothetical protein EZS28_021583, partial [Streblomastix strix]